MINNGTCKEWAKIGRLMISGFNDYSKKLENRTIRYACPKPKKGGKKK